MTEDEKLSICRVPVRRIRRSQALVLFDDVAVEEPLEVRLLYWFKEAQMIQSLGLIMRTPGHDRHMVIGSLLSEGVIETQSDILEIRNLGSEPSNEIVVELARCVDVEAWRLARATYVNSSCGICGKRSLESIAGPPTVETDTLLMDANALIKLPDRLREQQAVFARTGGLHAAALATPAGEILALFEDVGRHNALDKLLGWCVAQSLLPLREHVVFMSSRSSFELLHKLIMAGGRMMVTVGAPSSLAIETARAYGITLVGFLRENQFNIYAGEWRINLEVSEAPVS